jgi:outer membrane receptor protein involved in Fe transport
MAVLVAAPAMAQETVPSTDESAIEEIVVTAQLRSERLQDVPISVQVVGASAIATQNLPTMTALAQTVPSVRISEGGRSSAFFIRGIGSAENQSLDQSVGTFVDGVYHGRSRATTGLLLDVDRVEILKGPQSTFFGNNAIGGAFSIVTKKPGQRTDGWVRGLLSPRGGTHGGQYALEGAASLPFNNDLSLRLAGTYNGQRGWLLNRNDHMRVPNQENYAVRATLAYAPSDTFDLTLKAEYGRSLSRGGAAFQNDHCPPIAPFTAQGFCATALGLGGPIGIEKNEYSGSSGVRTAIRLYETNLTANYALGDHVLTSVTGYWGYRYNLNLDTDGTRLTLLNIQAPERYRQFSQEIRLTSPTGGALEYVAGLYFQSDRLDIQQGSTFFFLSPVLQATPALAPLAPYAPLGQLVNATQEERIYSAFASLTWNVGDRFKLSGGGARQPGQEGVRLAFDLWHRYTRLRRHCTLARQSPTHRRCTRSGHVRERISGTERPCADAFHPCAI